MSADATIQFAIDGRGPQQVVYPETLDELVRSAIAAHADNLAIIPVGNGTQLHIGRTPARYDLALSTRRLNRILFHEAADMTVTVEAGVTLAQLNAALAPARQRLPLDPPHPAQTTIGALIATDASGPLRLAHGKVRDLLIGLTVVLADGTLAHGGGRVVKNVAGYDLMKLFTGSFGTLGIIVEATFKLRPLPQLEQTLALPIAGTGAAVARSLEVLSAAVAPDYIAAVSRAGAACVGLDGSAVIAGCAGTVEEIDVQRQRIEERVGPDAVRVCDAIEAARLYAALRDFPAARVLPLAVRPLGASQYESVCGCKISILPSQLGSVLERVEEGAERRNLEAAMVSHVGNGIAFIRFSGAALMEVMPSFAEWVGETVHAAGGWTVFDLLPAGLKEHIDPWGHTAPPGLALMRGIKQTLDPTGCLSPGRFVGGI